MGRRQYDRRDGVTTRAPARAAERDRGRGVENAYMHARQVPPAETTVARGATAPTARARTERSITGGRIMRATAPAAGSPTAPAPLVLGRYRLHRRLGTGAFGSVWQARDERLERDVAVKLLPRERIAGGRFEREATAAARLAHPGIVRLYEAAVDDDGAYLVSELVIGSTLDRLLARGRLSDRDIARIGVALCEALAHAHAQGVVHRDVKPSNVLVPRRPATPAEVAKLTDFGVARLIGGNPLTRTGDVIGTAAYMAPEQAAGRPAEAPADLYALALVLYDALTGVNPLAKAPPGRRLGTYLPPLRRQRRDLPRALGQGIDLALRPRPGERGTIDELRDAVLEAGDQLGERPGIVVGPTAYRRREDEPAEPEPPPAEAIAAWDEPAPPATDPRLAGALAGATAAALNAWLSTHALASAPVAPLTAALVAGLVVAALPRIGWLALTGATAGTLVLQHRTGAAVVVAGPMLLPVALLARSPRAWPIGAIAPALGVIGLAGAWPALAGQARTAWRRAGLAVTGWAWLLVAGALAHRRLYTKTSIPPPSHWVHSPAQAVAHVLSPALTATNLSAAVIWALAALALPLIRFPRLPALDLAMLSGWAAALAIATLVAAPEVLPGEAILGGLAAGLLALAPDVTRRWWRSVTRATPRRDLRSMGTR
jgi:serine/threonine protein kinase